MHGRINRKTSNSNFDFKKSEYIDDKWIKIPSNNDDVGMNNYDEFTYKEIITRSLIIVDTIISKFPNGWKDI